MLRGVPDAIAQLSDKRIRECSGFRRAGERYTAGLAGA